MDTRPSDLQRALANSLNTSDNFNQVPLTIDAYEPCKGDLGHRSDLAERLNPLAAHVFKFHAQKPA